MKALDWILKVLDQILKALDWILKVFGYEVAPTWAFLYIVVDLVSFSAGEIRLLSSFQ